MIKPIKLKEGEPLICDIIARSSQKGSTYAQRYLISTCDSVARFYSSPSESKRSAEREILDEKASVGGYDYRIAGGGTYFFSCGYRALDEEGSEWLIYHTMLGRFAIKLR